MRRSLRKAGTRPPENDVLRGRRTRVGPAARAPARLSRVASRCRSDPMKTIATRGRATTRRKPRARLGQWSTALGRACAVATLAAVLLPGVAAAAGPEQQLAEKYAPVLGLKEHEPCADTGEPYRPVPVEAVLGHSDVVLLGPDGAVVKRAPTASDLFGKGDGYRLTFRATPSTRAAATSNGSTGSQPARRRRRTRTSSGNKTSSRSSTGSTTRSTTGTTSTRATGR